ncbi:MAG: hypothetical protein HY876_08050 [Coriobacteriales bacterium]|nr:hypothetical protein [Coriobacteriales bacterium]
MGYTSDQRGFDDVGRNPVWGNTGDDDGGTARVYDLEGVLGPRVIDFVEHHVQSLLAWDILVFFYRNPDAVLDVPGLASRLGRRVDEIEPEIDELCDGQILQCAGGLVRYRPSPEMRDCVTDFVEACQDRGRRLALIALVLHRIGRGPTGV